MKGVGARRLITPEQYNLMLKKQKGLCWICKDPPGKQRLALDHCHKTNRVRGLLCSACNTGLGLFKDKPGVLLRAARYLRST